MKKVWKYENYTYLCIVKQLKKNLIIMKTSVLTAHEGHFTKDFNNVNPQDVIFNIFRGVTKQLNIEYYPLGSLPADEMDSYYGYKSIRENYENWQKSPFIVVNLHLNDWFKHAVHNDNGNGYKFKKSITCVGFDLDDILTRIAISLFDVQHTDKYSREDWISLVAEFQERTYGEDATINWSNRWEFAKLWYGENCIVDSHPQSVEQETIEGFMKGRTNLLDLFSTKIVTNFGV